MDKISRDGDDQHNREKSKGEQEEETKNMFPFPKIFSFADTTDILLMVLGTTTAIASGMAIPLMTIIGGSLVNSFADAKDTKDMLNKVSKVALEFVSLGVGAGLASFFEVACWTVTGERQAARIRSLYLEAILRQDIAFFDQETKTGEVIERISRDISLIQDAISDKVGKFIQFTTTFLGGFIVAFTKGWLLSLVMLTSIPPIAISAAVFLIILGKISSRRQAAYSQAGNVAEQTISLIRTVASFTGEKQAIDKYDNYLTSAYKSGIQEGLVCAFGHSFPLSMTYLTYALGTWFGARMIIDKGYNAGDVINVIIALLMGAMALGQAFSCLGAFAAGKAATLKIFETINRKPHIDSYDTSSGKMFDDIRGDVELKDVYFSYPTRSDEKILNGFSLRMLSGMTLALVGQSGSGKSTVISLIERFYDPQAGEILIDGINLKEFQLLWIRKRIGLVSQEPVLFDSSIKDNIGYGKDDATLEEIRVATELANAAKFIDELPLGLDTLVGERGTQLSGGQKQRIAIARAILKDPRILLLDEATSALDSESEKLVQEALDGVMVNRTTLIVAHRLSTIRKADMIVVVHQGKVVEKGSHLELLEDPDGEYSQLIHLQENIKSSNDNVKQESKVEQDRHFGLQRSVSHGQPTHDIPSSTTKFDFPTRLGPEKVDPQDRDLVQPKQNHEIPFLRLAYLNKPELPILLFGTIFAAINGTLFPAFAVMFSSVFKIFYEPPSLLQNDSRFWALMFVTLSVISFIAISAKTLFFSIAGCKLIKRIRARCFEKVVHMEIGWFDEPEHSSGVISARLSTDAAIVPGLIGDALSLLVQNVTTLIVGIGIAFEANWQLALITLFLLPLLGVNAWAEMKFLTGFGADAKMTYGEASRVVSNAIGNIRTVVSFSAERKVMKLYENKCRAQTNIGIKQGLIRGISFGASFFIVFSVYATIFYAGARLIHDGKLTIPMFFRVFLVLTVTAMGVSHSISLGPDYGPAKASVVSIFKILDQKVKEDSNEDKSGLTLKDVTGEIEFRHVSFKYPIRPDVQIFHDFCLSINFGKTIALVGESGSGKSTVISLLQRFYDHDSGQITLDGIEIQKFQLRWLRQQMGLVSQEPILFNDTIRANIAYGKEAGEATEMDIIAASEQANAHTFVSGLQQGYNTVVGECGIQLSGGQKQRVAIARVILKSPKILLLDEATSALDAESEQMVQHALDQAMVNRTTIVVAHRLTTIRNVDLIAVVKNGIIVEKGNHDTLMSIKDGVYASLVAIQMDVSTN